MKVVPLPFEEFRGKGVLDFGSVSSDSFSPEHKWKNICYVGTEPTSVLDVRRNPSPPTSSSTLSSSHGGGSSDSSTGVPAENPPPSALDVAPPATAPVPERCGMGMEDWENVLSESPGQDQSIMRMIMGDIEDPCVGLSKLLQSTGKEDDVGFNGGFGVFVDQSSMLDPISSSNFPSNCSDFAFSNNIARAGSSMNPNTIFPPPPPPPVFPLEEKPQILNPHFILNQNQPPFIQHIPPPFVMPFTYHDHHHQHLLPPPPPPPAKRLNCGPIGPNNNFHLPKPPFSDSGGHELFLRPPPPVTKQKPVGSGEELQQSVMDKIFNATEMIETGNPELAQGILARLNHQLSPIGKPFQRAAFYMKEALQSSLLHHSTSSSSSSSTASSLLLKIGAYKSFSEVSPVLQFSNFTSNQTLLEAVDGFDRIHVIDFDIGFGGQWASFMQELALRNGGSPSLKITAFVPPSNHYNDLEIELSFTQEILKQYASEINISFELEILSLESLTTLTTSASEAIAVNLPIASFSHFPSYLPLVLRFVKQLMPKIVVTVDKPCDRTDAQFAQHLIYAIQAYSVLLESLDAGSVNLDVVQMIEKYLVQPAMEKIVLGRRRERTPTPPWKTMLLTLGFSPLTLSNFAESQAECLVQRNPGRGFHVEKKQCSSIVLCWQRKELISVSTWGC